MHEGLIRIRSICAFALLAVLSFWTACSTDREAPVTAPVDHPNAAVLLTGPPGDDAPIPIPGGVQPFPGSPFLHLFLPGPVSLGFMGENVEPNVITNFNGFAAIGYVAGTAQDHLGNTFDMVNDMRVFRGEYVSADGTHHRGTFAFI